MESHHRQASPSGQAIDLRIKKSANSADGKSVSTDGSKTSSKKHLADRLSKRRQINIFKKHKLKYQYLTKKHKHDKAKHTSDSGQFGSGSMQGSSSTTSNDKRSNDSTSSYTSSSPSSGASESPLNLVNGENSGMMNGDQPMCMMLRHAVPLVVMMQGQLQSGTESSGMTYSDTTLFKCNMCSMFSNNLSDVLNHVNTNHSSVHYCFVCNQFHQSKTEFERHKNICDTAHQAFRQIVGNHYQGSNQRSQDQALNLSIAGNVAMRAAQIIHSRKGRQSKLKKLQKCTYCKKAFFGRFYLQRHLRSHTGEKLCHCTICGKGFAEWRNLRNHMSRFHNSSQSSESGGQSKSVSPNMTSDSDQANQKKNPSETSNRSSDYQESKTYNPSTSSSQKTSKISSSCSGQSSNNVMEFPHPGDVLPSWPCSSGNDYPPSSTCSYMAQNAAPSPGYASSVTSETTNPALYSDSSQSRTPLPDVKPVAANLGSTSSRLQLSNSESLERSLNPVCADNGEKFFQCSMCSKKFRTKFAMQRHLDFHADKRPYQCNQCDYRAKTKPQLKVHVMRHSGEKGFHCKICNYACVTHSDLNRHCKSRSHMFRVSVLEQKDQAGTSISPIVISEPPAPTHLVQNTDDSSQAGTSMQ